MLGRKKGGLPAGATRTRRRRRYGSGTTGTGYDEGYVLNGVFYLDDGTEPSSLQYCGPAQEAGSGGDEGAGGYSSSSDSGGYSGGYDSGGSSGGYDGGGGGCGD